MGMGCFRFRTLNNIQSIYTVNIVGFCIEEKCKFYTDLNMLISLNFVDNCFFLILQHLHRQILGDIIFNAVTNSMSLHSGSSGLDNFHTYAIILLM